MPGLSLAPVNFGALAPNAMEQIGQGLGQLPNDLTQATLQNQQVGQQMLAPYLKMLRANQSLEDNPSFMSSLNNIAKRYGIPIPTMQDEVSAAAGGSGAATQPTTQPASTSATAAARPIAPAGDTAGPTPPSVPPASGFTFAGTPSGMQPGNASAAGVIASTSGLPQSLKGPGPNPPVPPVAASSGAPIPGAPQPAQSATAPTQTPQPTPTAGRPRTRIDPSWVASLDPQTVLALQQMQPDQRAAYLKATGVDPTWVPKELLNEPVVMDPAQKQKVLSGINTDIEKATLSGNMTAGFLQSLVNSNLKAGLIDQPTADSILNNSDALQQLGQGERTKLDLLLQSGLLKQDQYNLAIKRLNLMASGQASLEQHRAFEDQFMGARMAFMTVQQSQNQQRIDLDSQRLTDEANHWDEILGVEGARLSLSDYQDLANQAQKAESNVDSLQATAAQIRASNPNPDFTTPAQPGQKSFAQTLQDAIQLRDHLRQQLNDANKTYRNPDSTLKKQGVNVKGAGGTQLHLAGTDKRTQRQVYGPNANGQYFYDQAGTIPVPK